MRKELIWGLLLSVSVGCANEISGPQPGVSDSDSGDDAATSPSFVCNEQIETWVTIRGDGFSPLVVDAVDGKLEPSAVNPVVSLARVATPEGDAESGMSVTLDNANDVRVRWYSQQEMQVFVDPSLELEPGVYELTVTNENGATTTRPNAFGVLPRPTVTGLVPAFTCLAQGGKALLVEGDHFLVSGAGEAPAVVVGDKSYTPTAFDACRSLGAPFGEHQLCQNLTIELADADFEPSVQDVSVVNIAPASCTSLSEEDGSNLRVVPPPTVTDIIEDLACLAEGERMFVVNGADFISHDAGAPTVNIGGTSFDAAAAGCETVDVFNGSFERCSAAEFTIGQDGLAVGVHDIVVANPAPADCSSTEPLQLTIVPPPSITLVTPDLLCSEQLDAVVTIDGANLYVVDGTGPTVNIGGVDYPSTGAGCTAVDSVLNHMVQECTSVSVDIMAGDLPPGTQTIVVTNPAPAGCSSSEPLSITFVPPPSVTALVEEYNCIETRDVQVRVEGSGFLEVGGVLPDVTFGGMPVPISAVEGCTPVQGRTDVQTCDTLIVDIAQGSMADGVHGVVVTNPPTAGCSSTEQIDFELYPAPVITGAEPMLFCNDSADTTLTVSGEHFYVVNGAGPTVLVGGQMLAATADAASCTATNRTGLQECTQISVTVPAGTFGVGSAGIEVFNPEPVACFALTPGDVLIGGPPNIATSMPGGICGGASFDGVVTLVGDTFLRIGGVEPTVTVGGQTVAVDAMANCTVVPHPTLTVETCTDLTLTVPAALRANDIDIAVTNPPPVDCGSSTRTLVHADNPTVSAVTPLRICDAGATIQVDGTNFDSNLVVTLGGVPAQNVTVNAAGTSATAVFGQTNAGDQELAVINPTSTCDGAFSTLITIIPGPRAFFVDPPVLYSEVSTQVTIFLTGLQGGQVTSVAIVDSNGNSTTLQNMTFDPADPNRVQGVIPAGTLDATLDSDAFDIVLTDEINCSEQADDLVTITRTPTIALESIDPPFGWVNTATSVTIAATEPPPAGMVSFSATPRAYLNPSMPQAGDLATEVLSVQFVDAGQINGIVPDNLPVGSYDLIVLNPDGSVGVMTAAFDVTAETPPTIDSISPGSWETNVTAWPFVIEGADFRSPSVEVSCLDPGGNTDTAMVSITTDTATQIDATVDTSTFDHLSVCVIRVTNSDGTFAEFAPITITNPAGNFVSFNNGPNMRVARRGLSLAPGAATRTARFIYAIGGDDGTVNNPMASVEATALDRFGAPGAWFDLATALPGPRTLGRAVRVRDFVYMLGGHDGSSAVGNVSRARVLDPLQTTQVTNIEFDIDLSMTGGLAPGVYYYRVAPVLGAGDPVHPNGELLASERQPVRVPFDGISLDVAWSPFAGAVEYRVYRSPVPDAPAGTEELLAVIPAAQNRFVDDGTVATTAETPIPLGSLSVWRDVASLAEARHSFGAAIIADPATPDLFHIYLAGGEDASGSKLASIERLSVTVNGPADQTIDATGTTLTSALSVARSEMSLVGADPQTASLLSGPYLYALAGRDDSGMGFDRTTEVAEVLAGGDVAMFSATLDMQRSRAGYAAAVANNNIVAVCGQGGNPSSTADKMAISATVPPELDATSSLGGTGNLGDRYLMGTTSFSGLMYVAGGESNNAPADNTIDYSILGGTP